MDKMRNDISGSIACLLLFVGSAVSQPTPRVAIAGRVIDDSSFTPLHNVNVWLAHTTLGCATDQQGLFEIANVPFGPYELVASRVGYSMRSLQVSLSASGKQTFEIRLRPAAILVGEVVVSAPDPSEWRDQLNRFTSFFLGKSKNAEDCRILNPEILDFTEGVSFEASARSPLEIENLALGYHMSFLLTLFRVNYTSTAISERSPGVLTYEGLPRYSELTPATPDEKDRWRANRLRAYKGSLRNFLAALLKREVEQEGFVIYQTPYVAGVPIRSYDPAMGLVASGDGWDPLRRAVRAEDILQEGGTAYEKVVQFKGILEVEYTRETIEPEYDSLVKKGTDARVSWLRLMQESITVNTRGIVKNWFFPTVVYGYWGWQRIADMLPLDYEPDNE